MSRIQPEAIRNEVLAIIDKLGQQADDSDREEAVGWVSVFIDPETGHLYVHGDKDNDGLFTSRINAMVWSNIHTTSFNGTLTPEEKGLIGLALPVLPYGKPEDRGA